MPEQLPKIDIDLEANAKAFEDFEKERVEHVEEISVPVKPAEAPVTTEESLYRKDVEREQTEQGISRPLAANSSMVEQEKVQREGGVKIKIQEDPALLGGLRSKLEEYRGRLAGSSRNIPYASPEQSALIVDTKYKIAVLDALLRGGEVDKQALAEELSKSDTFDVEAFGNAYAVIEDYANTGGKENVFGTGLRIVQSGQQEQPTQQEQASAEAHNTAQPTEAAPDLADLREGIRGETSPQAKEAAVPIEQKEVAPKNESGGIWSLVTNRRVQEKVLGGIQQLAGGFIRGVGRMAGQHAGVQSIADVPRWAYQRFKVRGNAFASALTGGAMGEGLAGAIETATGISQEAREKGERKKFREMTDEEKKAVLSGENVSHEVRNALKDINERLKLTKEGSVEKSEQRKRLARLLWQTRYGKKDVTVQIAGAPEGQKKRVMDKDLLMQNILDDYTETKITGMQAARETLNSALTFSSAWMLRPVAYAALDGGARFANLKKQARRAAERGDERGEPKGVKIWRDVIVGGTIETVKELAGKGEGQKDMGFVRRTLTRGAALGRIARYAAIALPAIGPGDQWSERMNQDWNNIQETIAKGKDIFSSPDMSLAGRMGEVYDQILEPRFWENIERTKQGIESIKNFAGNVASGAAGAVEGARDHIPSIISNAGAGEVKAGDLHTAEDFMNQPPQEAPGASSVDTGTEAEVRTGETALASSEGISNLWDEKRAGETENILRGRFKGYFGKEPTLEDMQSFKGKDSSGILAEMKMRAGNQVPGQRYLENDTNIAGEAAKRGTQGGLEYKNANAVPGSAGVESAAGMKGAPGTQSGTRPEDYVPWRQGATRPIVPGEELQAKDGTNAAAETVLASAPAAPEKAPESFMDIIENTKPGMHDSIWRSLRDGILEKHPKEFGYKGDVNDKTALEEWAETTTANMWAEYEKAHGGTGKDLVHEGDVVSMKKGPDGAWQLDVEYKSGETPGVLPETTAASSGSGGSVGETIEMTMAGEKFDMERYFVQTQTAKPYENPDAWNRAIPELAKAKMDLERAEPGLGSIKQFFDSTAGKRLGEMSVSEIVNRRYDVQLADAFKNATGRDIAELEDITKRMADNQELVIARRNIMEPSTELNDLFVGTNNLLATDVRIHGDGSSVAEAVEPSLGAHQAEKAIGPDDMPITPDSSPVSDVRESGNPGQAPQAELIQSAPGIIPQQVSLALEKISYLEDQLRWRNIGSNIFHAPGMREFAAIDIHYFLKHPAVGPLAESYGFLRQVVSDFSDSGYPELRIPENLGTDYPAPNVESYIEDARQFLEAKKRGEYFAPRWFSL